MNKNYFYEDFTEKAYGQLIQKAKQRFDFIKYEEYKAPGNNLLWRHDIDFSVHRAFALARIEHALGIKSTFFVLLHSDFYNVLEPEIGRLVFGIIQMGHDLALHFDPSFYGPGARDKKMFTRHLKFEKNILEKIFDTQVKAFSFHNPETGNWLEEDRAECCGMVNAYCAYLKKNYTYCSDSNGYWRFERLKDTLERGGKCRLQVLTHPEWWTPLAMSPRERVSRCINGRALSQHKKYDDFLQSIPGRLNVK